ncbi:MAG: Spy/CpxP family protein refolding chaperone [Candidatus Ratteibacteria bacterium]|nr:Spy/CpxP family protein refolding chaperone [Candidatus Ratteibacteria bacterium]
MMSIQCIHIGYAQQKGGSMGNIKKVLVVAMIVLLVSSSFAFAQGNMMMREDGKMGMMGMREEGMGMMRGNMMGMRSRMGMGGKMDFERMFNYKVAFILMNSENLGITGVQEMKIKDLKYKVEKELIMSKAEIEAADVDIMQAFGKDDIDVAAIDKLIDKKYEAKKMQAKELVDACASLRAILTMDQQRKIKDLWSTHMMDGMKRMMKGRMMGTMADDDEGEYE